MKRLIKVLVGVILAITLLSSSACLMSRTFLRFEDHPTKKITAFETFDVYWYLIWVEGKHRFWLCTDEGDKLVCKAECDGDNDLVCPSWYADIYGGSSTNVR